MVEAHVGAEPVVVELVHALAAFRPAGGFERELRRQVCLAHQRSPVTLICKLLREPAADHVIGQINSIITHPVRQRQHAGQD